MAKARTFGNRRSGTMLYAYTKTTQRENKVNIMSFNMLLPTRVDSHNFVCEKLPTTKNVCTVQPNNLEMLLTHCAQRSLR